MVAFCLYLDLRWKVLKLAEMEEAEQNLPALKLRPPSQGMCVVLGLGPSRYLFP